MSIESLPDALNFGKNSRQLLAANVMPLLNKALQQTMLQLPANPTYNLAQFLRDNNPARGAQLIELTAPAIFLSPQDEESIANGAMKMDDVETQLLNLQTKIKARQQMAATASKPKKREKQTAAMAQNGEKRNSISESNSNHDDHPSGVTLEKNTENESGTRQQSEMDLGNNNDNHPSEGESTTSLPQQPPPKKKLQVKFSSEEPDVVVLGNSVLHNPDNKNTNDHQDSNLLPNQLQKNNDGVEKKNDDNSKNQEREESGPDAVEEEPGNDDEDDEEDEDEDAGENDQEARLLQQRLFDEQELLAGHLDSIREIAAASKEITMKFVGREKDGMTSQIRQNGRLPVFSVELPVLDGLETIFSRMNEIVYDFEKNQEPLQQHDMVNRNHCFFSSEREKTVTRVNNNSSDQQNDENNNMNKNNGIENSKSNNKRRERGYTNNKSKHFAEKKQIKIHFVLCGSVDVQCYIGGVCCRGILTQEICDIIRSQRKFSFAASNSNNNNDQSSSSLSSTDIGQDYESTCVKALRFGVKLRGNSLQDRFRQIIGVEQALKDAFENHHQQDQLRTESTSSSSSSSTTTKHHLYRSLPSQVHRLSEFHDSAVSDKYVENIHQIAESCAAERANGIYSVIALCSTYKASFVRNTCELFSAYFLQRQRALHLDRVGFAISNDENIRRLLEQTPLKLHEAALARRKSRDELRKKLVKDQARYLEVNGLKEDPEVERLFKSAVEERKKRREREDSAAIEMTNRCIHRAVLRVQMCGKMYLACKSLLEGRTAAVLSSKDLEGDADVAGYRIPDPALLHVVTEHLRDALGEDVIAPLDLPRPKPAIVQKRKILLVRHRKISKPKLLKDLDVSSEEEEWFEVEKERSSVSNSDAARAVVSAPCRPWDDVATLCRWCHEDRLLNECCDLSEEFSGRCSLENRLLKDCERLCYLMFYDIYCFILWRDRTAVNRYVNHYNNQQPPIGTTATGGLHHSFSFSQFIQDGEKFTQQLSSTPLSSPGNISDALELQSARGNNNNNNNDASSSSFPSPPASFTLQQQQQQTNNNNDVNSSPQFSQFLELFCSKAVSLISSSSWSVSTALGLFYNKPFLALTNSGMNQKNLHNNNNTNSLSLKSLNPVVLPMSYTEIVSSGSSVKELSKKTATAIAENSSSAQNTALKNITSMRRSSLKNNNNASSTPPPPAGARKNLIENNSASKSSITVGSKKENNQLVPYSSEQQQHQRAGASTPNAKNKRNHLESPWMRKTVTGNGNGTPPGEGDDDDGKSLHQHHPRRALGTVQTPISLASVNDHLFADQKNNKNSKKLSKNVLGSDDDDASIRTNNNDGNNHREQQQRQQQHRPPVSEGERSSEFGLLEAVGDNNNKNNNNPGFAATGGDQQNIQQNSRAIRLDPKLTAVEQPFPEQPGSFYFVSEAMPLKAVFDTSKNIFADHAWFVQCQQQVGNSSPSASSSLISTKGICWVSTVSDPILYVEEDEVISLSARPAHAKFALNDLLPANSFLGYTQNHPPCVKATNNNNARNMMSGKHNSSKNLLNPLNKNNLSNEMDSTISGSTAAPNNNNNNNSKIGGSHSGISSSSLDAQQNNKTGKTAFMMKSNSNLKNAKTEANFYSDFAASMNVGNNNHNHNNTIRESSSASLFATNNLQNNKHLVVSAPDPFSQSFWNQQENIFLEKVKKQLSKWKGALYLFGTQSYNEILMMTASNSNNSTNDSNTNSLSITKPTRGRCLLWFGPEAGGLYSTFFNATTSTTMRKLRLQQSNLLQHPGSIPKIKAIRKTFRVAPENLQYERAVGSVSASGANATEGLSFTEQLQMMQNNNSNNLVDSRPMSATHSSIGSWSDVVKLNRKRSNVGGNNNCDKKTKAKAKNSDGTSRNLNFDNQQQEIAEYDDYDDGEEDEEEEEESDDNDDGTKGNRNNKSTSSADAAKQLMLPSVRNAAAIEHLVRNKLVAYKCGHHNDQSKGDPHSFTYLRFPITDGFGKAFIDRLDEFRKSIQSQPQGVAFVFTVSSPTSVFTSLIAMIARMSMKSSPFSNKTHKNYLNLRRLAMQDLTFLATEVHVIFEQLAKIAFDSFLDVLILLRRANLLQPVVAVIDTHRQFAENASKAASSGVGLFGATKLPGTASNTADEFSDLSSVQRKKLVYWYAAQSAQKIERLCVLVMMHAHLASSSSTVNTNTNDSFYEFATSSSSSFSQLMKYYLLDRIDPWDVPVTKEHKEYLEKRQADSDKRKGNHQVNATSTTASSSLDVDSLENTQNSSSSKKFVARTPASSPSSSHLNNSSSNNSTSLLEKSMRKASLLPFASPLHPLSNATHKSKRWVKELWLERAA